MFSKVLSGFVAFSFGSFMVIVLTSEDRLLLGFGRFVVAAVTHLVTGDVVL